MIATEMIAISAQQISAEIGKHSILHGVSLALAAGRWTSIVGPNGAGKSTLLRVLATALRPDHGEVRVAGHDVRRELERVRRAVALLGHQSYLYEALSARENLEIAASFLGRRADPALLARVGLEARADDPVSSFSAGMRKRLALARVLLQAKPIVLLDEPYGELDPPGFALLDGVVGELRASGATVIMATHLVDHGRRLCDHALLLEAGRLAWSGPAAAMPAEAPAGSGPR